MTNFSTMERRTTLIATLSVVLAVNAGLSVSAFAQTQGSISPPPIASQSSQQASESIAKVFAPSGTLRASINLGNPVLASIDPATGKAVGVSVDLARELAARARRLKVLVNVEDVLPLCDFHVPAIVRRGELLLTASTGGQVPGLARRLREALAEQFGPEWTSFPIARLRYTAADKSWTLYWRDRNLRFHIYDLLAPSNRVDDLLNEIDRDPTCIFWG